MMLAHVLRRSNSHSRARGFAFADVDPIQLCRRLLACETTQTHRRLTTLRQDCSEHYIERHYCRHGVKRQGPVYSPAMAYVAASVLW